MTLRKDWTIEDCERNFEETGLKDAGWEIVTCVDDSECYEGHVQMLLRDSNGTIHNMEAGHCSCYGFEGQWGPVETNLEALRREYESHSKNVWRGGDWARALKEAIKEIYGEDV
jgi:hypothetical protein